MPLIRNRKRQAVHNPEPSGSTRTLTDIQEAEPVELTDGSSVSSPEPAQQRRRLSRDDEEGYGSSTSNQERNDPQEQMVKKLVRLALACEYNRRPIRRSDISEKVLGNSTGAKAFKTVFQAAQHELRMVFGMEMTELPGREKVTLQQKRGTLSATLREPSCVL